MRDPMLGWLSDSDYWEKLRCCGDKKSGNYMKMPSGLIKAVGRDFSTSSTGALRETRASIMPFRTGGPKFLTWAVIASEPWLVRHIFH